MAQERHQLPVVSLGAEYLVMGHLMRRNVLTYKAPPKNEGYDLICIHPDPRHAARKHAPQVRVQVKSRYATDCDRSFMVKEKTFEAFEFLIVAFLNIGRFYGGRDGSEGAAVPEFFTFPRTFVKKHHEVNYATWETVKLKHMEKRIAPYKNEAGFELIAKALGVPTPIRPTRRRRQGAR